MADVEVAVWFGGEAGVNTAVKFPAFHILINDIPNKIRRRCRRFVSHEILQLV
jgi:hypothetical protein